MPGKIVGVCVRYMMPSARALDRYTRPALFFGEEGQEEPKGAHDFVAGPPVSIEHRVAALNIHHILSRVAGKDDLRRGSAGSR